MSVARSSGAAPERVRPPVRMARERPRARRRSSSSKPSTPGPARVRVERDDVPERGQLLPHGLHLLQLLRRTETSTAAAPESRRMYSTCLAGSVG